MLVRVKKLDENAIIPTRGSDNAAGYDLYNNGSGDLIILPGDTANIHTGISVELPNGYYGAIAARSGLACKSGLRPANCVGIIDSDYRGELIVCLRNDTKKPQVIGARERVAQLLLLPYQTMDFVEVDNLSDTERGEGGFGSTGK